LRRFALVLVVLIVLALTSGSYAAHGANKGGNFSVFCTFTHRAPDDPIVYPGRPGLSHSHDFFGNTSTDAFSTYDSLRAGRTSCTNKLDESGYWVPTLSYKGRAVSPQTAAIYYVANGKPAGSFHAFPAGLEMIAGDAHATHPAASGNVTWGCAFPSRIRHHRSAPRCPAGRNLELTVRFQDCWDGQHLDSADHRSHVANASKGTCPADHPVALPMINARFQWAVRGGKSVTLASGPSFTAHADFFNAWDQPTLEGLVARCLNTGVQCGEVQ
jgi:hypothetical protein